MSATSKKEIVMFFRLGTTADCLKIDILILVDQKIYWRKYRKIQENFQKIRKLVIISQS